MGRKLEKITTINTKDMKVKLGMVWALRALTADTCGGVSPSVNVCRLSSAIHEGRFLASSGSKVSRTCTRPNNHRLHPTHHSSRHSVKSYAP